MVEGGPKIVWITGAGKGLGLATAEAYAARGDKVAVSARTRPDLDALAERFPGLIFPYPLDVTDEEATAETVAAIEHDLGPIDIGILNAGTHDPTPLGRFTAQRVGHLFQVNMMGTVHGLVHLMNRMAERGRGRIGVVASLSGYRGLPYASAYGATKAGLINMCESLYPELLEKGVRLSVINPGFVRTPLTDRNDFPMPFLMEADEAAKRVVRGLDGQGFEIAFPRRFAMILKLFKRLPYPIYFAFTKKMLSDERG